MASESTSVPSAAMSLPILDFKGESHSFSSLYMDNEEDEKTLIIFIRHYFCGSCKQYISSLSEENGFCDEELIALKKRLVIIGCGDFNLIEQYARETKCPFPIYTDPTQKLHEIFELRRTLSLGEKKPNYIKSSFLSNLLKSALSQITAGSNMFKGGDIQQVGGEYLIDKHGRIIWSHKMENTRDHSEVDELHKVLTLN